VVDTVETAAATTTEIETITTTITITAEGTTTIPTTEVVVVATTRAEETTTAAIPDPAVIITEEATKEEETNATTDTGEETKEATEESLSIVPDPDRHHPDREDKIEEDSTEASLDQIPALMSIREIRGETTIEGPTKTEQEAQEIIITGGTIRRKDILVRVDRVVIDLKDNSNRRKISQVLLIKKDDLE